MNSFYIAVTPRKRKILKRTIDPNMQLAISRCITKTKHKTRLKENFLTRTRITSHTSTPHKIKPRKGYYTFPHTDQLKNNQKFSTPIRILNSESLSVQRHHFNSISFYSLSSHISSTNIPLHITINAIKLFHLQSPTITI